MSLTSEDAIKVSKGVDDVFGGLEEVISRASVSLMFHYDGCPENPFSVSEVAAKCIERLDRVEKSAGFVSAALTFERRYFINEAVQRGGIERLSFVPVNCTCLHELAQEVVLDTFSSLRIGAAMRAAFNFDVPRRTSAEAMEELSTECRQAGVEFSICVLECLVKAIESTGFSQGQFAVMRDMARREAAAIASAIGKASDRKPDPPRQLQAPAETQGSDRADSIESGPGLGIPDEYRTVAMSKKVAIRRLGEFVPVIHRSCERKSLQWLNDCIEADPPEIRWEKDTRSQGYYHVEDFPEAIREKIRLHPKKSSP
ncbi:hypothetical protein [Rhodopirellula europaea]|uniref:hypothetical protein n=1 Tax=Rhodopirellula europaea TaxID=1263866 RepID=UPI003D267A1D